MNVSSSKISRLALISSLEDQRIVRDWSHEELLTIQNILKELPGGNILDREQCIIALRSNDFLDEHNWALDDAVDFIDKIPPAIICLSHGNMDVLPKPLSLKDMKEMVGQPIWIMENSYPGWALICHEGLDIQIKTIWGTISHSNQYDHFENYGKSWIAYSIGSHI